VRPGPPRSSIRRALAWALSAAILSAGASARGDPADLTPPDSDFELARAIALFENFDDEGATAVLKPILAQQPPNRVAAKVHLYLGLIALNALRTDEARAELKQALVIDPTLELPPVASPKTKTVFGQVRQQVEAEAEAVPNKHSGPAPSTAVSTDKPPPEVEPGHSHWGSWTLGGIAVVAGAAAIYGGVEVVAYNSLIAAATTSPRSYTSSQIASARSIAEVASPGWIVAAGVGAACLTAAFFTW
jgi:tetratricopeptide (TPR) repeat protein